MQNLSLFITATIVLAMTPGQDFIYVMVRSISQGIRAGFISIAGLFIGVMMHTLAAATGAAAILLTSAYAFTIIKVLGSFYLIYLGIRTFRQQGKLKISKTKYHASDLKLLKEGMLSSTLNPKLALFFMAFLPQFVKADSDAFVNMFLLGILFLVLSLPILIAVVLFSSKFSEILSDNEKVSTLIGRTTGLILVGLGIRLGLVES